MRNEPSEAIAAVVIGRNEGGRLVRCLESVGRQVGRVVYVDSGSSDDSVARARDLGCEVVALESGPWSAARARRAGLDRILGEPSAPEFVLFIDGDCVLQPDFVANGVSCLADRPDGGAVCARRREEHPAKNLYHAVIDVDWDIPPGEVPYTGGDGVFRVRAIREAGNWDPGLIAGEEPDLCFRMRAKGWKIQRIPGEMTLHDIRMDRLSSYLRRHVRGGFADLEVGWRHRSGLGRRWLRRAAGSVFIGAVVPLVTIGLTAAFGPVGILGLAPLLWSGVRLYAGCRRTGRSVRTSLVYGGLNLLGKFAAAWGALRYIVSRGLGRESRIVEYRKE